VGITPASVPEAARTSDIGADQAAAGFTLARAAHRPPCLASALVRRRGDDLIVYCKAWRVATPPATTAR
jgi:hypothetical protein